MLNKYSSSVSPRMLQTFIDRTDVLGLFGIFISGFFYSIISILLLQNVAAEDHVMAGSFAIAYAIVAMVGFVVFAKQVLENIKISNIIEGVYTDCDALIDGEVARRESAKRYEDDKDAKEFPVLATTTGYLYDIQTEAILKALDGIKAEFTIKTNRRIRHGRGVCGCVEAFRRKESQWRRNRRFDRCRRRGHGDQCF